MLGIKCTVENSLILQAAYNSRLLLVPAADNVVRVLPPLNISEEELRIAEERFKSLVQDVKEKK